MMGMTITIEIADQKVGEDTFEKIYSYFQYIDNTFSVFKETSEISRINRGEIEKKDYSSDMKEIFKLSEQTKYDTNGYFDIQTPSGTYNPSGLVKGWAIYNASKILLADGFQNFYVDAGGDIQTHGLNTEGKPWSIGIRNPFHPETEIIKVLSLGNNEGVATSGNYIRGQHIYNPLTKENQLQDIVSVTIIAANVYEADRFATAVFAMGREGIHFIEKQKGLEGYAIDAKGIATMTSGFTMYVKK
jgi:thiamine biosynthesis lipoprotein